MRIGVVVRAFNEEQHIGRLLSGLEEQTLQPDEVVVVDSGSTDATVEIARHFGAVIQHIRPEEFTFGRSLNLGIEACDADVVLLMSAHVHPLYTSHVERMVDPFNEPSAAVSYGRQVGDERSTFSELRVMRRWFPSSGSGVQDHPFSNNANAAVRRRIWEELRYDEGLTGLEDLDFASRAQDAGYDVHYVAEAPVVHVHEEPWGVVRNRYRREAIAYSKISRGWRLSAFEAARLALSNLVADYAHAALERRFAKNLWSIPSFRTAQFLGAWEGARAGSEVTEALRQRFYYPSSITRVDGLDPQLGSLIQYGEEAWKRL